MRQEPETSSAMNSLSELLARYLGNEARRIEAGGQPQQPGSDIELHDAGPVQAVDPRLAWEEAIAALHAVGSKEATFSSSSVPDWRGLVSAQEPALDLAFCAGNFPQMVRNLNLLLQSEPTSVASRPTPFQSASLKEWAGKSARKPLPQALLAAGLLRLAQDYSTAEALLAECASSAPKEWKAACLNEQASLAWHAGHRQEATRLWEKGDAAHVPTLFNRGMAALFEGRPAEAITPLKQAISMLPESGSWHHLARLYLTLAEMRR